MTRTDSYRLFLNNTRFYILVATFLLSLGVLAATRLLIPDDQLFVIRLQQIFGLLCILYWYAALVISPIGYVIGKQRMKKVEFSRRAIGVSAFYFALLHAAVALWGQLGGFSGLAYLPQIFQWSLLGGLGALIILFIMAITSFDAVVRWMTFKKWKWLHRLVYIGGVVAVLHIWSIGTHLAYTPVQVVALIALIVLAGLELFRVTKLLNRKHLHLERLESGTVFLTLWVIVSVLILMLPFAVQNYHSQHVGEAKDGNSRGHQHGGLR